MESTIYIASFVIIAIAFLLIRRNFSALKKHDEGTDEMKELAGIIRDGANTFLRREYRVIIPTVVFIAILYTLFMEKFAGIALLFGALLNMVAVEIGMRAGTYGNVRTANAARVTKALSRTMRIALLGGSVSGFAVPAFGLFGFLIIWIVTGGADAGAESSGLIVQSAVSPITMRLGCYSLGFSLIGMFNRVAGGNFTKAADISADIVGKNIHNMPEDDSRMPNTIADFIGDNVNDIAGNISDLGESFVATPVACILIAMQVFKNNPAALTAACLFPFILSAGGLLSSLVGISSVIFANRKRTKVGEDGEKTTISREIKDPELELDLATYLSAIMVFVIGLVGAYLVFGKISDMFEYGWIAPWGAAVLGVISSVAVGKITEYYTSIKYRPVQKLKEMAFEGDSFVVTMGDAIGQRSVLLPILVIGVSMMISFKLCGSYGIAIAGLGMLSFVGTTVSIDAFGPISDNAGGIAESCHLEPGVRRITDKLDSAGNTTAAIGKGNAIGSAYFATTAFTVSYFGSFDTSNIDPLVMIIYLMIGLLIGGGVVKYFSSLLTTNTITSAKDLADAGEEQLRIPGVIEGTKRPDYNGIVDLGTSNSMKRMLLPSILALLTPFVFGHTFGPIFMLGILLGGTVMAVGLAIYNGNSGGAFDNAKKSIEEDLSNDPDNEALIRAHKASVTGDTVGDTRKDVVCVDLDIFIKTMSTVSNTLVHNFAAFHLF